MLRIHLRQDLEPRIVVVLQDLSWGDLMPVELTQMVIHSAIEIEVDPRLFLKGAILRVPCDPFKLNLELLIPNTVANKRNSLSWSKLEQWWLARESPDIVVLLILHSISECLWIDILYRHALSGGGTSTRSRWLRLSIDALRSVWSTSILTALGHLTSIIIVVTIAHLKVHHKLFSMI